jgi:hypothetical protein
LAFAQGGGFALPDSLQQKISTNKIADSLRQLRQQANLAALQKKVSLQRLRDSLHIQLWGDSVRQKFNLQTATDSLGIKQKIDSLQNLRLPATKYECKLDSLRQKHDQVKSEINAKQSELQQKTTGRLKTWEQDMRARLKLDSLDIDTSISTPGIKSLSDQLPGSALPGLPDLNLANSDFELPGIPPMPQLNVEDFTTLALSPDLSKLASEIDLPGLDDWKDIAEKLSTINGNIDQVTGMLQFPDKAAETALSKMDEIGSAGKELKEMEGAMKENEALQLAESVKDPEALKEEAKKRAAEKAIDHFAGKDELLKKSMASISKYKAKIPSLESLSKLPKHWKRPKNGLKGRSFRERFRPGLNLEVKNYKDTLLIGFLPQVAYRITGRLSAGAGGFYLLKENKKNWKTIRYEPQWGVTSFATFKLAKSFHWRVEANAIHTTYKNMNPEIPARHEWKYSALMGVQNVFKINNFFSANTQMLYNFQHKFIHSIPERLILRFGVEYTLPKKRASIKN